MSVPLAERIRPQTIEEVVGQQHILGEGKPLRKIIESGVIPNMISVSYTHLDVYKRQV